MRPTDDDFDFTRDEIEEARARLEEEPYSEMCEDCGARYVCLAPPLMDRDEIEGAVEKMEGQAKDADTAVGLSMMASLMYAGENRKMVGCPMFIQRIEKDPDFLNHIKAVMQGREKFVKTERGRHGTKED